MKAKLEILGMVLGCLGLAGTVAATVMPMWKVSAFIGANLIVMEELWEGLWMTCYRQADIKLQCKAYDSLLILPAELQAARGLMCLSVILAVASLAVSGCGTQKNNCCRDNGKSKDVTLAVGGGLFLLTSLTALVPVCWVAHTIIRNFYNPALDDSQKRGLGASLFVCWVTSGVLLIAGIVFLLSFSKRRSKRKQTDIALLVDLRRTESVRTERTRPSFHEHHEYV